MNCDSHTGNQFGIAAVHTSSAFSLTAPMPFLQIVTRTNTQSVAIQTVPEPSDQNAYTAPTVFQRDPNACPIGKYPPAAR